MISRRMRPPSSRQHGTRRLRNKIWVALLFLPLSTPLLEAENPAPSTAVSPTELMDITGRTGITFTHNSSPDARYIVESMSGGIALIDYDRDGWPDIYFTNSPSFDDATKKVRAKSALYHNNHDGTFTDVTEKAGVGYPCWAQGAAVGDYNNDGWPDLLVTCFGGVVLYRNNGDGTFTDVNKDAGLDKDRGWATGASFGEVNGGGQLDLFVAHYVDFALDDLPTFGSRNTCRYHNVAVQCGPRGLKGMGDSYYRNRGNGTFEEVGKQTGTSDPKAYFGLTAVWTRLDESQSQPQLFVANDGEPNFLYRRLGQGHFEDIAFDAGVAFNRDGVEQANMGVALGDYAHDGRFALALSHFSEEYTTVYRNQGRLNFDDVSYSSGIAKGTVSYVGWGNAFVDLSNSGWLDYVQVNGHIYPQVGQAGIGVAYREPMAVFTNQHTGLFADSSKASGAAVQVPRVSRGLAIGDLFNDGHLEIVVENLEGAPTILRPKTDPANYWIGLELQGTRSNGSAINSIVHVRAGHLSEVDEVRSGGSYISQSDLRLHFGLGHSAQVDEIEVDWPSGHKDVYHNLAADQIYRLVEGSEHPSVLK